MSGTRNPLRARLKNKVFRKTIKRRELSEICSNHAQAIQVADEDVTCPNEQHELTVDKSGSHSTPKDGKVVVYRIRSSKCCCNTLEKYLHKWFPFYFYCYREVTLPLCEQCELPVVCEQHKHGVSKFQNGDWTVTDQHDLVVKISTKKMVDSSTQTEKNRNKLKRLFHIALKYQRTGSTVVRPSKSTGRLATK